MAQLRLSAQEEAIRARLATIPGIGGVFISEVPDLTTLPMANGRPKPFITIYFGGPYRSWDDHHITGTINDALIMGVTVQCRAITAQAANELRDKAFNLLCGWAPPDSGEMYAEGVVIYSVASPVMKPTEYYRECAFTWRTNLTWKDGVE